MLILSRKRGESIIIGPDIRITVVGSRGQQVRLGIEAPRDVSVVRNEIAESRIHDAAQSPDSTDPEKRKKRFFLF